MKHPATVLSNNCKNCNHFDGDCHCAFQGYRLIEGAILLPMRVVCSNHEPIDKDAA